MALSVPISWGDPGPGMARLAGSHRIVPLIALIYRRGPAKTTMVPPTPPRRMPTRCRHDADGDADAMPT
jgi:hypothetical protein